MKDEDFLIAANDSWLASCGDVVEVIFFCFFYCSFQIKIVSLPKNRKMNYLRQLLAIVFIAVTSSGAATSFSYQGIVYNTLPDGSVEVGKNNQCENNVTIPESVEYQGKTYQVTSVQENAFSWLKNLQSVSLPESVASIGSDAFFNCQSLEKVSMPGKITEIKSGTFGECPMLSEISLPSTVIAIGSGAFENCKSLQRLTIPKGLKILESRCFSGCEKLEELILPDEMETFEDRMFVGCSSLRSVHLPNWLTTIPYATFNGCKSLTAYSFEAPLTEIGERAFTGTGLTEVYLPKNITSVSEYAFSGCALTDVWLEHTDYDNEWPYFISDKAFDGITRHFATLHVPEGCYTFFRYGGNWNFETIVETNTSGKTYRQLHLSANINMCDIVVNGQHLWLGQEAHLPVVDGSDIELCLKQDEKLYGEYTYYCDKLSVNGVDRLAEMQGDTLTIHHVDADMNVDIHFREGGPVLILRQGDGNMVRMIMSPDWYRRVIVEASSGYHIKDAYYIDQTIRPTESESRQWIMDLSGSKNKLIVNYEKD